MMFVSPGGLFGRVDHYVFVEHRDPAAEMEVVEVLVRARAQLEDLHVLPADRHIAIRGATRPRIASVTGAAEEYAGAVYAVVPGGNGRSEPIP